jgi:hypothetical protein
MTEKGKILNTLSIYSDECLTLLRQALEVAESEHAATATAQTTRLASTFQKGSRYADSSEDEEEEKDLKDSSSSDEDEDDEAETTRSSQFPPSSSLNSSLATEKSVLPPTGSSGAAVTAASNQNTRAPQKQVKKVSIDERQREQQIRKLVENLVCVSLPVPEPEQAALDLPMSLLHKDDRMAETPVSTCRSFLSVAKDLQNKPVVILLLRSGRFAGGVFQGDVCITHRTLQRYTVRKGQGKAQSAQDGNSRAQSMGSQLRRAGEISLREDCTKTLLDWKEHMEKASLILISCPKTMKKGLFEGLEEVMRRGDSRIRRVPIDTGRPTFEGVSLIHSVMMRATLREWQMPLSESPTEETPPTEKEEKLSSRTKHIETKEKENLVETFIPLTELHHAAKAGDLQAIRAILESEDVSSIDVEQLAGEDFMTPLHFAAESAANVDASAAADSVYTLLVQGRANPTLVDGRHRVPIFLASNDKVRDAFRMARAKLGEEYCNWDKDAKVGPPLTDEDIEARKQKELEKKRQKRARQKEKKANEKAETAEIEENRRQQEALIKQEEDAKRVRDGLQPKATSATNICDFCQKVCKGRRRNQMFQRLDYVYCNAECVQKHKRELMAAAAMSRFGN